MTPAEQKTEKNFIALNYKVDALNDLINTQNRIIIDLKHQLGLKSTKLDKSEDNISITNSEDSSLISDRPTVKFTKPPLPPSSPKSSSSSKAKPKSVLKGHKKSSFSVGSKPSNYQEVYDDRILVSVVIL